MRAIVEKVFEQNAFVRDLDEWERWYLHIYDCQDGTLPEQGSIVTFTPDRDFPRGLRAVDVVVVAAPAPDAHKRCVDCGDTFTLAPGEQAWYRTKGYPRPSRCKPCREQRKGAA